MTDDPRLEWLRANIPHFADYNDQVLRVEEEERANKEHFAECRGVARKPAGYEGEGE